MNIRQNTTWKFKEGKGDKYRRLRVIDVLDNGDIQVRSFYLDEVIWPYHDDKRGNPRRQPKTITLQKRTLLQNYVCLTTNRSEGSYSSSAVAEFSGGMLR